jgi:hypothetical protein
MGFNKRNRDTLNVHRQISRILIELPHLAGAHEVGMFQKAQASRALFQSIKYLCLAKKADNI